MKSTFFPHFTIGTDAYDAIPGICREYGKTAVIVGGNKSRAAAEPLIRKACEGTIEITGSFLYGDDATFENAEALTKIPEIQKADMIFAVGGGRAVDFSALDAEFSALQSGSAELRSQLKTLQPDLTALKNVRKYIDMVLNKQQLSAPGGKTPGKESVLKKLNDSKSALEQKNSQPHQKTTEHTL